MPYEFKSVRRDWPNGPAQCKHVTCVYRRSKPADEWQPWVVVAPSALLHRLGVSGRGLYAARAFRREERIGQYGGTVLGTFASRDEALASPFCGPDRDKLITRRPSEGGPGVQLVCGHAAGPPFLQLINDPRGTRLGANVRLTQGGWVIALRARAKRFDLRRGLEANIGAELRLAYGDDFWDGRDGDGREKKK